MVSQQSNMFAFVELFTFQFRFQSTVNSPLFCSEKCKALHLRADKYHENTHMLESQNQHIILLDRIFMKIYDVFGSVDAMRSFVESQGDRNQRFGDLDWMKANKGSPAYWKNMLIVIMSTRDKPFRDLEPMRKIIREIPKLADSVNSRMFKIFAWENPKNRKFSEKLLTQIAIIYSSSIVYEPSTSRKNVFANFSHPAMLDLSNNCDGNIFMHIQKGREVVWIVNQPIAAGEKLFYSTGHPSKGFYYTAASKQDKCNKPEICIPCRKDWAKKFDIVEAGVDQYDFDIFYEDKSNDPTKVDSYLKHHDAICEFINKNCNGYDKSSAVRQLIGSKKIQLLSNLEMIANVFPQKNVFRYGDISQEQLFKILDYNDLDSFTIGEISELEDECRKDASKRLVV